MTNRPYSMFCHTQPGEEAFVEEFTNNCTRVRAARRRMGGSWDLSWRFPIELPDSRKLDSGYLRDWFDNRLFFTIKQHIGGDVVWDGVVWKMDLSLDGIKFRREYPDIFNRVRVDYIDGDGDSQSTSWYEDNGSINAYGYRENILYLQNASASLAQADAQTFLTENKDAYEKVIQISGRLKDQLEVWAVGKMLTANNRYVGTTTLDGTTSNLDVVIESVVENDCQFLSVGKMKTNAISYKRSLDQPMRAWDFAFELTKIGDGTNPYLFWVDNQGYAHYDQAETDPTLYWYGREGGVSSDQGEMTPEMAWSLRPGILRNMTRQGGDPLPNSFLTDIRDTAIFEIEMADSMAYPNFKPEDRQRDEVARAMEMYQTWLEEEEDGLVYDPFNRGQRVKYGYG